jgi:endonuclease III
LFFVSRESFEQKKAHAQTIVERLKAVYPDAHCELNHSNPFQLLIATILSAQCSDKQVNLVTEALFKKYPSASDFANAPLLDLEEQIKRIGLFRNKSKNIQAACRALVERHGGVVPNTMQELLKLEGVGRKTANVVLGDAFGMAEGVVVDTHVARLSLRLGFSTHTNPEKIEKDLQALVPMAEWTLLSHLLIWHGRRRCFARNPDCPNCELKESCPTGQKNLKLTPKTRSSLNV